MTIKPIDMDNSLKTIIIDIDGQIVRYDHGPQIPTPVVWPGPRGTTQVRVQVDPPGSGTTFGSLFEGPWALLRLFDRVSVRADRQLADDVPRRPRRRRPQGHLRSDGEQRAQSVQAARSCTTSSARWACELAPAAATPMSPEPRRPTSAKSRPGTASCRRCGDFAQRRMPADCLAAVDAGSRRRCATAASSSANAGSTST